MELTALCEAPHVDASREGTSPPLLPVGSGETLQMLEVLEFFLRHHSTCKVVALSIGLGIRLEYSDTHAVDA